VEEERDDAVVTVKYESLFRAAQYGRAQQGAVLRLLEGDGVAPSNDTRCTRSWLKTGLYS